MPLLYAYIFTIEDNKQEKAILQYKFFLNYLLQPIFYYTRLTQSHM